MTQKGQSLLELVVGLSLIVVVVGALAIITTYGLRNSQFSKNQTLATKYAQENLEKVRAIKNGNYGVCLTGEVSTACSQTWDTMMTRNISAEEKYTVLNSGCTIAGTTTPKPLCLTSWTLSGHSPITGTIFSGEISIINEPVAQANSNQKKVISRIYWTDNSGDHMSDLVTIISRY